MPIQRINEFPEGSGSLSNDDIFLFMDDPSGSGITKKISLNNTGLILSSTGNVSGASKVTNIVSISQSNYDNLVSKDPNTVYIIT